MDIFIWGSGKRARAIQDIFRCCWKEEYNVIGFVSPVDKDIEKNTNVESGICNADEVFRLAIEGKEMGIYLDGMDTVIKDSIKKNVLTNLCISEVTFDFPEVFPIKNGILCEKGKCFGSEYIFKETTVIPNSFFSVAMIFSNDGKLFQRCIEADEASDYYKLFCLPSLKDNTQIVNIEKLCIPGINQGRNRWIFFSDTLCKLWALKKRGFKGEYLLFDNLFSREAVKLLDIDNHIIWINESSDNRLYCVKELHYLETNMESDKLLNECLLQYAGYMRGKDWNALCLAVYPKRIMVYTKDSECEINSEILDKYGVEKICFDVIPLIEQVMYMYCADIVILASGELSSNKIFMRPNTALIEIFPTNRVKPLGGNLMLERRQLYFMVVGKSYTYDEYEEWDNSYKVYDFYIENALKLAIAAVGGNRA